MTIQAVCTWFDISRQAFYQMEARLQAQALEEEIVLEMVQALRQRHPRMGGRKLHWELQASFQEAGIRLGRDRFFDLLRRHQLLVPKRKRRPRTTLPGWRRAPNLLLGLEITRPNQVWVADITYLGTEGGFVYLFLITDVYSRCILGWHLAASLAAEGGLAALEMAVTTANTDLTGLIHHSDRGVQYTCLDYLTRLQAWGIRPSMGRRGNCYENAVAERVNGILKDEYLLDGLFVDYLQALQATRQAVALYNHERPHTSLGYAKPYAVYMAAASGRLKAQGRQRLEQAVAL